MKSLYQYLWFQIFADDDAIYVHRSRCNIYSCIADVIRRCIYLDYWLSYRGVRASWRNIPNVDKDLKLECSLCATDFTVCFYCIIFLSLLRCEKRDTAFVLSTTFDDTWENLILIANAGLVIMHFVCNTNVSNTGPNLIEFVIRCLWQLANAYLHLWIMQILS